MVLILELYCIKISSKKKLKQKFLECKPRYTAVFLKYRRINAYYYLQQVQPPRIIWYVIVNDFNLDNAGLINDRFCSSIYKQLHYCTIIIPVIIIKILLNTAYLDSIHNDGNVYKPAPIIWSLTFLVFPYIQLRRFNWMVYMHCIALYIACYT